MRHRGIWAAWIILLGWAGSVGADPNTAAGSPAVRQAKQEYDAAVKKAEDDLAAARKVYLERLDAALKAAMQAGDLDEANRIDALRKTARTGTPAAGDVAAKPAAAGLKPGWIIGTITDSGGKPITGATFEITAFGTTFKGGDRASFPLEIDAGGHFEQEVPDGLYAVTGYIEKQFGGSTFRMPLYPADGKPAQTKVSSKPGIVKDFVWKLTGLQPGLDATQKTSYYGQYVRVYDANYLGEENEKLLGKYGRDAKAVVTLTPTGPLLDGSKGEPVVVTGPLSQVGNTLGQVGQDVPIGAFKATAKVATAAGKEQPLRLSTTFRGEPAASIDVAFKQKGRYDSIEPITVYLKE